MINPSPSQKAGCNGKSRRKEREEKKKLLNPPS
jgi:hypothetical protein